MDEIKEIKEQIKESGAKQKRKIGKRGRIIVISSITIIAILIGAIFYVTLTSPPPEKYWKPEREFRMPVVNWSDIKNNYTVKRTHYNDINGTVINQTIGSEKSDGFFKVCLAVKIMDYTYRPHNFDIIGTSFSLCFVKLGGDYTVKELIFKFKPSDSDVRTPSFDDHYFAAKNLYFTADTGNYPTPYGTVSDRMDYELWTLHQIRGINKDKKDIKEGGFSNSFQIDLFDEYPNWTNHTITFTATLYYGKYVQGWLGSGWQDVHELSTSVVIYVIPEGGV